MGNWQWQQSVLWWEKRLLWLPVIEIESLDFPTPQHISNNEFGGRGHRHTAILKKHSYKLVLWAELCPLKRYAQVLIPGTCEYELIWEQGVCRWNQIKMRSLEHSLTQYDWCPYNREMSREEGDTRVEFHVMRKAEVGVIRLHARNNKDQWPSPEIRKRPGKILPETFRMSMVLP